MIRLLALPIASALVRIGVEAASTSINTTENRRREQKTTPAMPCRKTQQKHKKQQASSSSQVKPFVMMRVYAS